MLNRYLPKTIKKISDKPKFTATDFMGRVKGHSQELSDKAVIVFSRSLYKIMLTNFQMVPTEYPYDGYFDQCIDKNTGTMVIRLYPGAPLTVATVEELAALGVSKFLLLGTAGSISGKAHFNDVILCTKALRDEGTSYHYIRPSMYAFPSRELTQAVFNICSTSGIKLKKGASWTTDAPYMETVSEIHLYQKRNIVTVEMEASAFFAVSKARNLETAAVFSVSDELHDSAWTGIRDPDEGFRKLAEIGRQFMKL